MIVTSLTLAVALLGGSLSLILAQTRDNLTRVTLSSDEDRDSESPSLSADGRQVAFQSDFDFLGQGIADNQFEIWLYDTATMTFTRVTTASAGNRDSFDPVLSAKGTRVAFRSNSDFLDQDLPSNRTEVWLYDRNANAHTRLSPASGENRVSFAPSLSADGTKVAFVSDSDFFRQGIRPGQFEIWRYDLETMELTRITTASNNLRTSENPALSDDGTTIAFDSDSDFLDQSIPLFQYEVWLYNSE